MLVERVEQEENFDLFLRAASALLGLGGGLFTGARRALERRRLSKLNDMLRAMVSATQRTAGEGVVGCVTLFVDQVPLS